MPKQQTIPKYSLKKQQTIPKYALNKQQTIPKYALNKQETIPKYALNKQETIPKYAQTTNNKLYLNMPSTNNKPYLNIPSTNIKQPTIPKYALGLSAIEFENFFRESCLNPRKTPIGKSVLLKDHYFGESAAEDRVGVKHTVAATL